MAHKSPMLHSIYDLTTYCRATKGDVPPKLIGASTTVLGSKVFLFGGRSVNERRIVSDLYVFDMETFVWEQLPNEPEEYVPPPRYFHSADAWNNHLIVFGGMSRQPDSSNPDELCVLNDIHFFDLTTGRWLPPPSFPDGLDSSPPRSRYAHLSSVTGDRLFIIGGQDFQNTWLDDICAFNFISQTWTQQHYPRHCGTYRSVAISSPTVIRIPQEELQSNSTSTLGPPGARFGPKPGDPPDVTSEKLVHLPYLAVPTEDYPSNIYLYSNYNFTDVKRELEVFTPLPHGDFTVRDRSSLMTGSTFPPGLRFPTGAVLGTHLIIAGTYLAHSYQSFSIWVLDLTKMAWSRIDPGKAIETGSWFRGSLYAEANQFLIFGNRHGNLVDDYNRRLLSWDHVAVVDLEAFGIYQPPPLKLDLRMQELGLAALEEHILTDFEIICEDGQRIPCSRRLLEERWRWFKEARIRFVENAERAMDSLPTSPMHIPLPELPGTDSFGETRVDPRLTPRALYLSEPYPISLAFLQYLYSLALITPLQHTPGVLGQLLILATNYRILHLESLVKHAMHQTLTNPSSVGVYEVTTLCSSRSLQIRALKTVMAYTQKRPSRRVEKENAGNVLSDNTGSRFSGNNGSFSKYVSRPRGTSDVAWGNVTDKNGMSSAGYNSRSNQYPSVSISMRTSEAPLMANSLNDPKAIDNGRVGMDGPGSSIHAASAHGLAPVSEPSKQSKPVLPAILPAFVAPQMMATFPASSSAKTPSSTQSPKSARPRESPATILNDSALDHLSNSVQNTSRPPAGSSFPLPPPMLTRLPRRPTTSDGHVPSNSQSSSTEDIRAGYRSRRNSNAANPLTQAPSSLKNPQPSNPLSQRNQRPTIQISQSSTASPTDFVIGEQRSTFASENAAFTTQPLLEGRSSEVGARDGVVTNDQKPSHWPKQAPNVHWITAEETPTKSKMAAESQTHP